MAICDHHFWKHGVMTQEAARTHCNRCTSHGLVIRASNSGVIPENVWRNQLPPSLYPTCCHSKDFGKNGHQGNEDLSTVAGEAKCSLKGVVLISPSFLRNPLVLLVFWIGVDCNVCQVQVRFQLVTKYCCTNERPPQLVFTN